MRSAVVLLTIVCGLGIALPANARADDPITIEPLHELTFPESPDTYQIALSPDGSELFVQLTISAINVWAVPVMYWPEIGGAIVGLVLLLSGARLWRIANRRRRCGQPYCGKCGYCLTNCPSEQCPECGHSADSPVTGRSFLRRTWALWAAMLLVAAPYATAMTLRLPRSGLMSDQPVWWSPWLADFVARYKLDQHLPEANYWLSRIVVVDTLSGQVKRTLPLRMLNVFDFSMEVTPDGRGLFVRAGVAGFGTEILLLDAESGRISGRFEGAGSRAKGKVLGSPRMNGSPLCERWT